MKVIQIAKAKSESRDNPNKYRVYDTKGIAPCLNSMGGGGLEPHIAMKVKNATKEGSIEIRVGGVMNIAFPQSDTRRGRVIDEGNTSPTLDTGCEIGQLTEDLRIRKLTPKECFRLQGFPDEYFERAAEVCSDSQLYKQAGNSVTVNVIYEIAKRLKENKK